MRVGKKVWNLTNCPWNISPPGKGGQTFNALVGHRAGFLRGWSSRIFGLPLGFFDFFSLLSCAAQETPATRFTLYLLIKVEEAVAGTFRLLDRFLIDSQPWNHLAIFELPLNCHLLFKVFKASSPYHITIRIYTHVQTSFGTMERVNYRI